MAVRAKFQCVSKVPNPADPSIVDVRLSAVYGDGTDNAEWSRWTPLGVLDMQITNEAAHAQLEEGKTYLLDITPAP